MPADVMTHEIGKAAGLRPAWIRYGVAIAAVAVAVGIRVAGWPVLHADIPWILFAPAIMVAVWVGGMAPGLVATLLSAVAVDYLLLEPYGSLGVTNTSQAVGYGVFVLTGLLISWMVGLARAVQARLEETARGLRRANGALREGEVRLQAIVESLTEGMVVADLDGNLVGWNRASIEMHGFSSQEEGQRALREFAGIFELSGMDGTVLPLEQWPLARILRGERLNGCDVRIRRPGSNWERVFSYGGTLTYGADGRPLMAVVTVNDITERKLAEQALRRAKDEWERTFDSVPDLIAILDTDYRIVRTNRAMAERLGVTPNATIGLSCYACVHGTAEPPADCPHARTLLDGRQHVAEVHEEHLRGHFLVSTTPLNDEEGRMVGSVHVARDITDRKRAEERTRFLSEASNVLASSLDYEETLQRVARLALPALADVCAIDVVEEDGRVRRVAAAAADPTQQALVEGLRCSAPDVPCPAGVSRVVRTGKPLLVPEVGESMLAAAARGEHHLEILRELPLRSFISVPLVARGRVLGAISLLMAASGRRCGEEDLEVAEELGRRAALAIDNSRLYAAERDARAAAEEADRAKDQFVALISHELRNPLNAIQAGVGLLQHTAAHDARSSRALEIIERNTRLQARLVNDLLDLSRLQREKLQFQRAPIELAKVVAAAEQALAGEAAEAGLTLTCSVQPGLWVNGDFDRLQQVVTNILANAVKFTPAGGEIRVGVWECERVGEANHTAAGNTAGESTEPRPDHPHTPTPPHSRTPARVARIVVEDTGIGIDCDQLDTLFEVFHQGEVGAQRRPGLGLGLALVKGIAERHGGSVRAESEGPGKGSRFVVELPLVAAPRVRAAQPEPVGACPHPIGILVIEDNPDTRALVADTLTLAGYEVQTAGSGEDALELLREGDACHEPRHAPGLACARSTQRPDMILCDIGLPGMNGFEFIQRARELPGMAEVPAFAVTGFGSEEDVRHGRETGFVGHFVKPVDIRALDARIREWVGTAPGDQGP